MRLGIAFIYDRARCERACAFWGARIYGRLRAGRLRAGRLRVARVARGTRGRGEVCGEVNVLGWEAEWGWGTSMLVNAQKHITSREILLWMTPSEAPKALQASACNELLGPTGAICWIVAQCQPGKIAKFM